LLAQGDVVHAFPRDQSDALPAPVASLDVDIRDLAAVHDAFDQARPEAVYHLAAISSIATAQANPRLTFETNVGGTFNMFAAAMHMPKPPRILNVSTSQVYSDETSRITEGSPLGPSSPYAASKLMAEQVAVFFANADCITVRPFNHSGPEQSTDFVLSSFAAQIAEMEAGLRASVLQVGDMDVERDFLDVRDVVQAYRLLIERGRRGQVYDLASGTTFSIASIVEMFRLLTPKKFDIQIIPSRQRSGQRQRISADTAKIEADTGWKPRIPLQRTLRDLLAYWRTVQEKATASAQVSNRNET
jgi:GDP-4-dehydro-6-deoxy-D-mannose reductase